MKYESSIETAQRSAPGYLTIFRYAQGVLDAISCGDSAGVLELLAPYPGASLPEGGRLKDDFNFRQMQGCMVLGLLLHHGYLLQLPASALYDIFENRTYDIIHAKNVLHVRDALIAAALGMCSLVKERQTLHSNRALRLANEYVESHLTDGISAQDVANFVELSVGYLNTLFKTEIHCTLHQFILEKRLRLAQTLLTTSDTPIAAIAADLHFSSSSHFGHVFKTHTGYTPLQYRRQARTGFTSQEAPEAQKDAASS